MIRHLLTLLISLGFLWAADNVEADKRPWTVIHNFDGFTDHVELAISKNQATVKKPVVVFLDIDHTLLIYLMGGRCLSISQNLPSQITALKEKYGDAFIVHLLTTREENIREKTIIDLSSVGLNEGVHYNQIIFTRASRKNSKSKGELARFFLCDGSFSCAPSAVLFYDNDKRHLASFELHLVGDCPTYLFLRSSIVLGGLDFYKEIVRKSTQRSQEKRPLPGSVIVRSNSLTIMPKTPAIEYVEKSTGSKLSSVLDEYIAAEIYRICGASVPDQGLYTAGTKLGNEVQTVRISRFIDSRIYSHDEIVRDLAKHFVIDAILGNDAIFELDRGKKQLVNVCYGQDGHLYRVGFSYALFDGRRSTTCHWRFEDKTYLRGDYGDNPPLVSDVLKVLTVESIQAQIQLFFSKLNDIEKMIDEIAKVVSYENAEKLKDRLRERVKDLSMVTPGEWKKILPQSPSSEGQPKHASGLQDQDAIK